MKRMIAVLTLAVGMGPASTWAQADAYPSKPVRLVVGFALGQPVVVENRPGADVRNVRGT